LFFLDARVRTGKPFLLDKILETIRVEGKIALAVASIGIAAVLLMGGRKAHSRVKFGLDLCFNVQYIRAVIKCQAPSADKFYCLA
jgi:hypothetical protein